jgi:general secretion pathway protein K
MGRSDEGIALVAVLWILTLLSIVAASLSLETRSSTRIARNMAENAAARAAADAGIQRAILDLETSPGAPGNTGKIRTDGTVYNWQFANCSVRLSIQDQLAKLNVNQAPEALLAALIESTGVEHAKAQSLSDAIADFRDADNLRRPQGAEEAEYQNAGLGWGPKNAPLQSLEELQQVLGMTPEIYARLIPDLTIYSIGIAINPILAGERLTRILRQTGFKYFGSQEINVYFVRAEAKGSRGVLFTREAVLQLIPNERFPWVLSWKQRAPES